MKKLKKIGIIFIAIYIFICIFVFFYQENLIFFPSKHIGEIPKNVEEINFFTEDNIQLNAWFLDNNSAKTVLFFHGNAGNIFNRKKQLAIFDELNLNALIFDYRGYGKSFGEIKKEENLYIDGIAAYEYLTKEKNIKSTDLIIWGRSLGGAIAIDLAQNKNIFAVVIESTFFSLDEMASKKFWFLPVKIISQYHFKNQKKIKNIQSKILIIHSQNDKLIPSSQGKNLFELAKNPKKFLEINGSHNNGFLQSYDLYIFELRKFLLL
jgi:uncharacterized protein